MKKIVIPVVAVFGLCLPSVAAAGFSGQLRTRVTQQVVRQTPKSLTDIQFAALTQKYPYSVGQVEKTRIQLERQHPFPAGPAGMLPIGDTPADTALKRGSSRRETNLTVYFSSMNSRNCRISSGLNPSEST